MRGSKTLLTSLLAAALALSLPACSDDDGKKGLGGLCQGGADCTDAVCHHGTCSLANPLDLGAPCVLDAQCKSFSCLAGACAPGSQAQGGACRFNEECLSTICQTAGSPPGICAADKPLDGGADTAPDAAPPDAGLDAPQDLGVDVGIDTYDDAPTVDAPVLPDAAPEAAASDAGDAALSDAAPDLADAAWPPLWPCGNGKVEGAEVCDTVDLQGKACADFSYPSGLLSCSSDCKTLIVADCYAMPDHPKWLAMATSNAAERNPSVATDGTNWLVIWEDVTANKIRGRRVKADGTYLDKTPIDIATTGSPPQVAYLGSKYLVFWPKSSGINRALVEPATGAVSSVAVLKAGTGGSAYRAARLGNATLVVWDTGSDVKGLRVDASGTALGKVLDIADKSTHIEKQPWVASDGKAWFVVWIERTNSAPATSYHVHGTKVALNGNVTPTTVQISPNNVTHPSVSFDGKHYLAFWNRAASTYTDRAYAVQVNASTMTVVGTPLKIISEAKYPGGPRPDYDAVRSHVVAVTNKGSDIVLNRLNLNASPPEALHMNVAATKSEEWDPEVAAAKDYALIVWQVNDDIHAARFK